MARKYFLYDTTNEIIHLLLDNFKRKFNVGAIFLHTVDSNSLDHFDTQKEFFCELCGNGDITDIAQSCHEDHLKRGFVQRRKNRIELCYLGLFNTSFPIRVDGMIIAALLIGQIKIEGKEKESYDKLEAFFSKASLKEDKKNLLLERCKAINTINEGFFKTDIIPEGEFIAKLIQTLIEQERLSKIRMSSIAHELLLPIQSIIIDSETLRDETYEDIIEINFIRENASNILYEVSKLNMHINNLRRVVKFSAVDNAYDFEELNLFPLIESARTLFKKEADLKGIALKKQTCTHGKFPSIFVVKEELSIALNNIFSNAIKYSYSQNRFKDERFITTECTTETIDSKHYFTIEVSNFGVPILNSEIEGGLLYKAGYRSEYSKDRNRTGSGIGLFLVKDIIERIHEGQVIIKSFPKANGNFTVVKICLPYERGIYNAVKKKI